jgi:hypothetical protein
LLVAGGVGDDELPQGGGEIAVRDVDRDALLALGDEPVGQQRQIERPASLLRGALDRGELVGEDRLRVVKELPDQRARCRRRCPPSGTAAHRVEHRGVPQPTSVAFRLRSSIEASWV